MLRLLCISGTKSGQPFWKSPKHLSTCGAFDAKLKITVEAPLHTWLHVLTKLADKVKHFEDEENVCLLAVTGRHQDADLGHQRYRSGRTNVSSRFAVLRPYLYIFDVPDAARLRLPK